MVAGGGEGEEAAKLAWVERGGTEGEGVEGEGAGVGEEREEGGLGEEEEGGEEGLVGESSSPPSSPSSFFRCWKFLGFEIENPGFVC